MILVRADKQTGSEAVETALCRLSCCFKKPHLIALTAAVTDILSNHPDKGPQSIVILHENGQVDGLGILLQAVPPGTVFRDGVDVGVVPETGNFNTICPQNFDWLVCAGGAANMEQGLHSAS